ncbi:hypothetical protein V8C42DRAFT_336531 [Trichoderma barbatum]
MRQISRISSFWGVSLALMFRLRHSSYAAANTLLRYAGLAPLCLKLAAISGTEATRSLHLVRNANLTTRFQTHLYLEYVISSYMYAKRVSWRYDDAAVIGYVMVKLS